MSLLGIASKDGPVGSLKRHRKPSDIEGMSYFEVYNLIEKVE